MTGRLRWAALGAAVLALLLAAVAARSGPSHPLDQLAPQTAASRPAATLPHPTLTLPNAPAQNESNRASHSWLVIALISIAGLVLAVLLYRLLRGVLRRGLPGVSRTVPVGPPSPDSAGVVALVDDAVEAGLADVERGPVSDAVIACWVRVEAAAREAGVPLHAADTSQEFAERVLGGGRASAGALNRLAVLYREARFSSHAMGEDARDEARTCLLTIRDELRSPHAPADLDATS